MSQHGSSLRPRPRARTALGRSVALTAGLAALNVARHVLPAKASPALGALSTGALLAVARRDGMSWRELGLGRHRLGAGGRWGVGAVAAVATSYAVGVAHPRTRQAFLDERYRLPAPAALRTALVVIPVGTVLVEEVAFRSVLWAFLSRHLPPRAVSLVSSSLFGLWHVLPALDHPAAGNDRRRTVAVVAGTVGFTALGGMVMGELRRRSDSVLAGAGLHWATNGLGVLFGLLARRLLDPAEA